MSRRTFKLNKLVRDNIVQIHLDMGGQLTYKVLPRERQTAALLKKLIEEVKELQAGQLSIGEIADLQEIIDQIISNLDLSKKEIAVIQAKKRRSNGGFKKGHYIKTVSLPADNKWAHYYANDPARFPEIPS